MNVRSDDTDIFVEVEGRGPDVVLLHASPADHRFWARCVERFASKYGVTMPDLRGHGQTDAGEGPATMAKHAEDLERICKEVGIARAVFVGCSIGGYVLFEFWRRHRERFAGLVLCNTKASADGEEARANRYRVAEEVVSRGPEKYLESLLPKLLGETTMRNRRDIVDAARESMSRSTAKNIAAVQRGMAERPDSTEILRRIDVPTMIVGGDEDTIIPRGELEKMAAGIPMSELKIIGAAGHFTPLEQGEEFGVLLRKYLDSLPRW